MDTSAIDHLTGGVICVVTTLLPVDADIGEPTLTKQVDWLSEHKVPTCH